MTKEMKNIVAGACQFDVKTGDIEANLACTITGISRLAKSSAQIAVLPELWSCGFDLPANIKAHARQTPRLLEALCALAIEHRMIIAGSLPEISGDSVYNTLYVVDRDGMIAGHYRKIHLFSLMEEGTAFSRGNAPVVCNTSIGKLGLMVCYDLRFPELCRALALSGARMLIVSAQWPEVRISHWNTLLQARAIENQLFVVACNRVGNDGDLVFNGSSQIISPDGNLLANLVDRAGEITASIDFKEIDILKNRFDCISERIPETYLGIIPETH